MYNHSVPYSWDVALCYFKTMTNNFPPFTSLKLISSVACSHPNLSVAQITNI